MISYTNFLIKHSFGNDLKMHARFLHFLNLHTSGNFAKYTEGRANSPLLRMDQVVWFDLISSSGVAGIDNRCRKVKQVR